MAGVDFLRHGLADAKRYFLVKSTLTNCVGVVNRQCEVVTLQVFLFAGDLYVINMSAKNTQTYQ